MQLAELAGKAFVFPLFPLENLLSQQHLVLEISFIFGKSSDKNCYLRTGYDWSLLCSKMPYWMCMFYF